MKRNQSSLFPVSAVQSAFLLPPLLLNYHVINPFCYLSCLDFPFWFDCPNIIGLEFSSSLYIPLRWLFQSVLSPDIRLSCHFYSSTDKHKMGNQDARALNLRLDFLFFPFTLSSSSAICASLRRLYLPLQLLVCFLSSERLCLFFYLSDITSCVTLGKLFNLSMPRAPHL